MDYTGWTKLKQIIPQEFKDHPEDITFHDITNLIVNVINLLLWAGAIAAFAMILYGGFQYMTSFGDESKTESAKKILTSAIVGAILMMSAILIINFVVGILGGTPVTKPTIQN